MPTVADVDGVKIVFYHNDHPPPHFHARFREHAAVVEIGSLTILAGFLPIAQKRRVLEWAASRKDVLAARFHAAVTLQIVEPVE